MNIKRFNESTDNGQLFNFILNEVSDINTVIDIYKYYFDEVDLIGFEFAMGSKLLNEFGGFSVIEPKDTKIPNFKCGLSLADVFNNEYYYTIIPYIEVLKEYEVPKEFHQRLDELIVDKNYYYLSDEVMIGGWDQNPKAISRYYTQDFTKIGNYVITNEIELSETIFKKLFNYNR